MKLIEILQGEPINPVRTPASDVVIPPHLRPGSPENENIDFFPTRPRQIGTKHSDANLPAMYIDWNQGYPSDEQAVKQVLAPWPEKGVNIQPYNAPDPRHRRGGVANDNYRRGEVLLK